MQHLADPAVPTLPGLWRFGWLLFMQPLKLHDMFRQWGLNADPSWWNLRHRMRAGEPVARGLLWRAAVWQFGLTPAAAVLFVMLFDAWHMPIQWGSVPFGVILGVVAGVVAGVVRGAAAGVAVGTAFGVAIGVVAGTGAGTTGGTVGVAAVAAVGGVALGVIVSVLVGMEFGGAVRPPLGLALGVIVGVAFAAVGGMFLGAVGGVSAGAAFGVAVAFSVWRLPVYMFEASWTWILSFSTRGGLLSPIRAVRLLPYRHDDLVYLPLPGLAELLVHVGTHEPKLALSLIVEAAESLGQKRPARHALVEMQARSLERAARDRRYARAAQLELDFLTAVDPPAAFGYFRAAARDLDAATLSGSHHHRRKLLDCARGA